MRIKVNYHNRYLQILLGCVVVLVFAIVISPTVSAATISLKDWQTECLRRNLMNSCACKCESKTREVQLWKFSDGHIGEKTAADQSSWSSATEAGIDYIVDSSGDYRRCPINVADNHRCTETYSATSNDATRISTNLILFPKLDNGIIEIDNNGQIMLGKSLTNLGSLVFAGIGLVSLGFGLFGAFKVSTAGSEEKTAETGRKYIKNAILGLLLSLGGLLAVAIISSVSGFNPSIENIDDKLTPTSVPNQDVDFLKKVFGIK